MYTFVSHFKNVSGKWYRNFKNWKTCLPDIEGGPMKCHLKDIYVKIRFHGGKDLNQFVGKGSWNISLDFTNKMV